MSAWSNLPNAAHIDWIIETVNAHQELWLATRWSAPTLRAWQTAYDAAYDAAIDVIQDPVYDTVYDAIADAIQNKNRRAAVSWAAGASLALIAYDDCDQYLAMSSEQLRAWALLTEHPAAILLLPMVVVREQIEQRDSV